MKVSKSSDNVEHIYLANGEKLAKKKNGQFVNFYCGSFVYKGDKSLEYISHGEGLALKNGSLFDYQFNLTDHLGNVRNVLNASNVSVQSNDYYPFGLTHNAVSNFAKNKYLYNGKEAQDETIGGTVFNLLDYGARLYDPVIAIWTGVDPLVEKNRRFSTYNYCSNNPINRIDPDGMLDDWYLDEETGELYYNRDLTTNTASVNGKEYQRVGDNDMMGDMGNVNEKKYDYDESQKIAEENGYAINPTQQLVYEESFHACMVTYKQNINLTVKEGVAINEKYNLFDISNRIANDKGVLLDQKNSVSVNPFSKNGRGTTIKRVVRKNLDYSKANVVDNYVSPFLSFTNRALGNHSSSKTVEYKNWNDYTKKTNDKYNLLKYKK